MEGNVYVFTRSLDITGEVVGSVHAVAERARIDGSVDGNCMSVSRDFTLSADGRVGRNGWLLVDDGVVDGHIERDLMVSGEELELRGEVGRNLAIRFVEEALIGPEARIGGNLDSLVHGDENLDIDPAARIGGEVKARAAKTAPEHYLDAYRKPRTYVMHAITFAAAFAFGLARPRVAARHLHRGHPHLPGLLPQPGLRLHPGVVVPPVAIVLAGITLVGLPAAAMAAFVYATCLYLAHLLVGVWLGRTFLGPEEEGSRWAFARVLFVGFAALSIASHLPFLGPPIGVVALLVGMGLVYQRARQLPVFAGA